MVKLFAQWQLPDEAATRRLAWRIAPRLRAGDVLLLEGDLGAGKTSFARAIIRMLLGTEAEVPSPTFTMLQVYEAPDFPIAHFDLYRLAQQDDIIELGWHSALEGLAIVEWPSRLGGWRPGTALTLAFAFDGEGRSATAQGDELWVTRVGNLSNESA